MRIRRVETIQNEIFVYSLNWILLFLKIIFVLLLLLLLLNWPLGNKRDEKIKQCYPHTKENEGKGKCEIWCFPW